MKERDDSALDAALASIDQQALETAISEAELSAVTSRKNRRLHSNGSRGWTRLEGSTWRRYYRQRDGAGKLKARSFKIGTISEYSTAAAARVAGDRMLDLRMPRTLPPGASPAWPQWVQRYLDTHVPRTRPSTQRTERCAIVKHLLPAFERQHVHEINATLIQRFIDRQNAGQRSRPKTIKDRVAILHRMLKAARREGLAAVPTPMSALAFPRDDRPHRTVADRAFTEAELEQILAHAVDPWVTLYRVMLFAGLRVGEALALRWSNIIWPELCIDIRASASRRVVTTTKTANSAVRQAMPPELAVCLQRYRNTTWRENAEGFLFPGIDALPLHSSGIGCNHLQPLLAQLNIRTRSTHAFRHSFGMRLGRLPGISLARLATAMRCSLRAAESYISATDADARAVIDAAARG